MSIELNIYRLVHNDEEDVKKLLESSVSIDNDEVVSNGILKINDKSYRQYFSLEKEWDKYGLIENQLVQNKGADFEAESNTLKSMSPSALYFLFIDSNWYVFTFGQGRYYLDKDKVISNWGSSIVLGLYEEKKGLLSTVSSHQFSHLGKRDKSTLQHGGRLDTFGIDDYRAIIDGVKLKLESKLFSVEGTISGATNLKINLTDINKYEDAIRGLNEFYESSRTIDTLNNIVKLSDDERLDEYQYINSIREEFVNTFKINIPTKLANKSWYSPNNLSFRRKNAKTNLTENISFDEIKNEITQLLLGVLDINNSMINERLDQVLEKYTIRAYNPVNADQKTSCSLLECISYSYSNNGNDYVLDEGDIFRLKNNLVQKVNRKCEDILNRKCSIELSSISDKFLEADYNEFLTKEEGWYLLDRKNVTLSGKSSFEIADVIVKLEDKYVLVHNKGSYNRNPGSSCLSHLALQVENSFHFLQGNLEQELKEQILKKLEEASIDIEDFNQKLSQNKIELVAGIVCSRNNELKIPDFSKLTFAEVDKKFNSVDVSFNILPIRRNNDLLA